MSPRRRSQLRREREVEAGAPLLHNRWKGKRTEKGARQEQDKRHKALCLLGDARNWEGVGEAGLEDVLGGPIWMGYVGLKIAPRRSGYVLLMFSIVWAVLAIPRRRW